MSARRAIDATAPAPAIDGGVTTSERRGRIVSASGPVVRATGLIGAAIGDAVRVGPERLLGEVIGLAGDVATLQVYEETVGLRIGDPVATDAAPLRAWLGPGLLGTIIDGLQRPLAALAAGGAWDLRPGAEADALDTTRRWRFAPRLGPGDGAGPGDVLGTVAEGGLEHRILVPPDGPRGTIATLEPGDYRVGEPLGELDVVVGRAPLTLDHRWPIRRPRPTGRRLDLTEPLVTGQRVIDMVVPLARGGTAIIPGGFGTGKTVLEQAFARSAEADVVVYVGCGERGNEMAELLADFAGLTDPRTGRPLLERTVLIANTSNMPVAAREASVQLGATIAEYYRDQGHDVALLADSTSRWAEALREIGGRLEELPGEEGFPAYLGSRLAAFYERAGRARALGEPERVGSVTIVGAVSPPGGDFSEPVTQASLRVAGALWALDADLAHARHFPAVGWAQSYSLYADRLAPWYRATVGEDWPARRAELVALLARERELLEIVQLVGPEALPDADRVTLTVARLARETFLRQHAFDVHDGSRPPAVQMALLRAVLAARGALDAAIGAGATLAEALALPAIGALRGTTELPGAEALAALGRLLAELTGEAAIDADAPTIDAPPPEPDG